MTGSYPIFIYPCYDLAMTYTFIHYRRWLFAALISIPMLTAQVRGAPADTTAKTAQEPGYRVITQYPHNTALFTQGLELYKGRMFESTGLYGRSKVISRHFPPKASQDPDLKGVALPDTAFAEGLSIYRDRLYLLTWRAQKGLILDPHHFSVLGAFAYQGEGWGLCFHPGLGDEGQFVMSNGSASLQWLSPTNMKLSHKVEVRENGKPVDKLNELECVGDYVVANVWQSDDIVFINAKSGNVVSRINLAALKPAVSSDQAVLNGIAYDSNDGSWLVTGKFWPVIYRLEIPLPLPQR